MVKGRQYPKKTNPFYHSSAWRAKRKEILERDNYECQWCKAEGKVKSNQSEKVILEIDHIEELDKRPDLKLDNDNLRTLCRAHHNQRHDKARHANFSKNKWADDEKW